MSEPEPTRADIERYALREGGEIVEILDELWGNATDLMSSPDFRDADGELLEGVYVRVKARAIRDAVEKLERLT